MDIIILILTGTIVGLLSSFFGIGGGSLMIPILYSLYPELSSKNIIAISLGTILLNSTCNIFKFNKIGLTPSKKIFLIFAIMAIVGTCIGFEILNYLDTNSSKKLFAIVLVFTVLKLFIFGNKITSNETIKEDVKILSLTGLMGSTLSTITGLGGGIIYNPMLLIVAKIPIKYVSAYSNVAMFFGSFIGIIPFLFTSSPTKLVSIKSYYLLQMSFIGNVNIGFIFILFLSSQITSQLGVKLNQSISSKNKKTLLAILLLILAIKILIS